MPIYEYKCNKCNKQIDLLQKMNAARVAQCPICLTDTAHRLVSAPSFQLKGDGWYVTDFKNKPADPSANPEATPQSTATADSKPDANNTNKTQQDASGKKTIDSKTTAEPKPAKAATQGETN